MDTTAAAANTVGVEGMAAMILVGAGVTASMGCEGDGGTDSAVDTTRPMGMDAGAMAMAMAMGTR